MNFQFDATEEFDGILPTRLFQFMQTHYWVCVFRDRKASIGDWCMSTNEPMPVPNQEMRWRRPTWEECLDVAMIPYLPWLKGEYKNQRKDIHEAGKRRNHKYAVEWKMKRNIFNNQDYPVAI